MTGLVVTGYASLDYAVGLEGNIAADETVRVKYRNPDAWPRAGGSPFYVASTAAKAGMQAAPLTWIGDDQPGRDYRRHCEGKKLETKAIATAKGQRSPVCIIAHQIDGTTACLFDPALSDGERLNDAQRQLLSAADHVCITVGPGHLLGEILSLCRGATLYWTIKRDRNAFPETLAAALARRANIVFCNRAERTFLGKLKAAPSIVVETQGANGVALTIDGEREHFAVNPVVVLDPTGAGDTFAGGFIAAFAQSKDARTAVQSGIDASATFLNERRNEEQGLA